MFFLIGTIITSALGAALIVIGRATTKKEVGLNFPVLALDDNLHPFQQDGPLCEVQCTARGFMRAHRSVFEKLKPFVPLKKDVVTGGMIHCYYQNPPEGHGDDFEFCKLWRKHGGRVMVDKRICTQHAGSALYPIPGTY